MGDGAAHQLKSPTLDELSLAIDVMKDLLNFIYEVEYRLETGAKIFATRLAKKIQTAKEKQEQGRLARKQAKAEEKAKIRLESSNTLNASNS